MARTTADFKRKVLALLKEDEEFRYAVVGLLGIEDLRSGQARLEEGQARLTEAIQKLTERHDSLELAVQKLAEAQARTEEALQELSRQVGRLSDTVGFGLEDIARVVVPGWLYRHEGIELENLTRKFIKVNGEELEINLYGEGSKGGAKITILGEAKSRIYSSDVEGFDRLAEKVKRFVPNNTYKLMFGYYVHPSAEQEAKKRGVTLIASYMR
jgi:exonuclease VII small subunit